MGKRNKIRCYRCKKILTGSSVSFMYYEKTEKLVPVCKDDRLCYWQSWEVVYSGEVCKKGKDKPDCHHRQKADEGRQGKRAKAAKD